MTDQRIDVSKDQLKPAKPASRAYRSKRDTLVKLLSRRTGATSDQLEKQLIWQPHTVRSAISRLRSAGVAVELDRSGKRARYRLVDGCSR